MVKKDRETNLRMIMNKKRLKSIRSLLYNGLSPAMCSAPHISNSGSRWKAVTRQRHGFNFRGGGNILISAWTQGYPFFPFCSGVRAVQALASRQKSQSLFALNPQVQTYTESSHWRILNNQIFTSFSESVVDPPKLKDNFRGCTGNLGLGEVKVSFKIHSQSVS